MINKIKVSIEYVRNLTRTTVVFIFLIIAQGIESLTRLLRTRLEGDETTFIEMQILLYVVLIRVNAMQILVSKVLKTKFREGKEREVYHLVISGTIMSLLLGVGIITAFVLPGIYLQNDFTYYFQKIAMWPLKRTASQAHQLHTLLIVYVHVITKVFYRVLLSALLGNGQAGYSLVLKGGGALIRLAGTLVTMMVYRAILNENLLTEDEKISRGIASFYASLVQQFIVSIIFVYGVVKLFYQFGEEKIGTLREASLSTFKENQLFTGNNFSSFIQYCFVKLFVVITFAIDVQVLKKFMMDKQKTPEYEAAIYTKIVHRISDMFTTLKLILLPEVEERILVKSETRNKVMLDVTKRVLLLASVVVAKEIITIQIFARKSRVMLKILVIFASLMRGMSFYFGAYSRHLEKRYVNQIHVTAVIIEVAILMGGGSLGLMTPERVIYTTFLLHFITAALLFTVVYLNINYGSKKVKREEESK